MGLRLPAELASMLSWLGLSWPDGDEEQMFEVGQAWLGLAGQLTGRLAEADAAAGSAWVGNSGRPLRDEYIAQFSEMLPHVFFGFVTEWLVNAYRADPGGGPDAVWRRMLDRFEGEYAAGDPDVEELLAASFLENLPYPDEPGGDIVDHLGPTMNAHVQTYR